MPESKPLGLSEHSAECCKGGELTSECRTCPNPVTMGQGGATPERGAMRALIGVSSAYEHNGDKALLEGLGLRTHDFGRDPTDLGTVVIHEAEEQTYGNPEETKIQPATTVKVEVTALPAQFWRFTITRPRDETEHYGKDEHGRDLWRAVYEPLERFEMTTGSGGFGTYWPTVKLIAEHMVNIERKS